MNILNQALELALTGKCNAEIKHVTKEDILNLSGKELSVLHKIMVASHVSLALAALQKSSFFDYLIPEIKECIDLHSHKQFKEIWPHTLNVINRTPPKLTLRWAALFHDLGKAKTFSIKNGIVTFHNHEKISAKIFSSFAQKSKIFSLDIKGSIYFLVSNLGYAESYESNWTDSAVRRFDKEMGFNLNDIIELSEADITTGNSKKRDKILRKISELKTRIEEIRAKDKAQISPLPKGLGTEIHEKLGVPLGPKIGDVKVMLENKITQGELLPNQDFEYYIEVLKNDVIP